MSATCLPALQAGMFAALSADDTYMALLNGRLYDDVPEDPMYPYATLGEAVETPDRTLGQGGHQVLCTLSIYTRDGSTDKTGKGTAGFAASEAIVAAQTAVLVNDTIPLVLDGFDVIVIEVESCETIRGTDGITRIIDTRYRVWIEDQA